MLAARRPDIPRLELTCENTNTLIPHIDLVNEALEYYLISKRYDIRFRPISGGEKLEPTQSTIDVLWVDGERLRIRISDSHGKVVFDESEPDLRSGAALDGLKRLFDPGPPPVSSALSPDQKEKHINDAAEAASFPLSKPLNNMPPGASSDDYLAEPLLLLEEAYEPLAEAHYPFELPFNLPLETARAFCRHLGTSLFEVMDVLTPPSDAAKFSRHFANSIELLGISPQQADVLKAEVNGDELAKHFRKVYGYGADAPIDAGVPEGEPEKIDESQVGIRTLLLSARSLADRLGVTYLELEEIIGTKFIHSGDNPLQLVPVDGDHLDDFSKTFLVHMDDGVEKPGGEVLDPRPSVVEYLRINYFVRLWRLLGWTLRELDDALDLFLPISPEKLLPPDVSDNPEIGNIGTAMADVLLCFANLKRIEQALGGISVGTSCSLFCNTVLPRNESGNCWRGRSAMRSQTSRSWSG